MSSSPPTSRTGRSSARSGGDGGRRNPEPSDEGWARRRDRFGLRLPEPHPAPLLTDLARVPEATLRARIGTEIRGGDPRRLQRVIWLLAPTGAIDDRAEILGHLAAGASAKLAQEVLDRLAPPEPPPDATLHHRLRAPRPPRRRPPP